MKILSFDIGGSKISSAVIDQNGDFLRRVKTHPTPESSQQIFDLLQSECSDNEYSGAALATAGIVENNNLPSKPYNLPNGYENIDFSALFRTNYLIENDANAAAWAEFKKGNMQNCRHGVLLTLGTGVGCGIICDSRLLRGKHGAAGEIYMDCSGNSMRKMAAASGIADTDCFAVYKSAQSGDVAALNVYNAWQDQLFKGMRQINQLLDTEMFVLSGSLAKIVDFSGINHRLQSEIPNNPPLVRPAHYGNDAGLVGAALLYGEKYEEI